VHLVAGLGNPGERYVGTRHNVGFEVVERLAAPRGCRLEFDKRLNARVGTTRLGAEDVLLVQPCAYMNLSGPVVARLSRERDVPAAQVLVISDDFHLPIGKLRVRLQGSAGGHNWLKSLIQSLGSEEFPRLRIGIGEPTHGDVERFVLTRFKPAERDTIAEALDRAASCVEDWFREGPTAAMSRHNS
jgi:PTH1 family peptidyl-tRNA hydrolase